MRFEWDPAKNESNRLKHGLELQEATDLFAASDYLEIPDEGHSDDEERFLGIGSIQRGVIVVVWTERNEDVIRLISARHATKSEIELYRRYMEDET